MALKGKKKGDRQVVLLEIVWGLFINSDLRHDLVITLSNTVATSLRWLFKFTS